MRAIDAYIFWSLLFFSVVECTITFFIKAYFLLPFLVIFWWQKKLRFNEKVNLACDNNKNNREKKIYASMARMSVNDECPSGNFGDSSQLTNWVLYCGVTCHMTPEVSDFIPGSLEDTDTSKKIRCGSEYHQIVKCPKPPKYNKKRRNKVSFNGKGNRECDNGKKTVTKIYMHLWHTCLVMKNVVEILAIAHN